MCVCVCLCVCARVCVCAFVRLCVLITNLVRYCRLRCKRAKNVKDIAVGKKFIEEEHDHRSGKKKQRRMMPGGRIDIS
jgi:hypothetical protein